MKIRLLPALVGVATSFAVPAFAQQKDTFDPEVRQQIEAALTNFEEAYNKILCRHCEARFSGLDAHGWKILGNPDLSHPYFDHNFQLVGYTVTCDTGKLRRFILSVLWRASVSKVPFYQHLRLGIHEKSVINRVFDRDPLLPEEYPTTIFRLDKHFLGKGIHMIFPPLTDKLSSGGLMCTLLSSE